MAKPNKKVRNLDTIVAQRSEAMGGEHIEFEFAGTTWSMPHPRLADDDWKEELQAAGENELAIARVALGDEQYDKFREAGGRAAYIGLLLEDVMNEEQGSTPAGNPTASSTSSVNTLKQSKQTS